MAREQHDLRPGAGLPAGVAAAALAAVEAPSTTVATRMSARAIASLVSRGELSAEDVLGEHLHAVAELDPALRSLVHVDSDRAFARARKIDEARRRGRRVGPLAGVPFVVKDNIDVRGETTSCGSRAHEGVVALRDATVVARLREAGAILIGRANMDELAMGASTQTSAFGATRNPWDPRRSPGGSSGGSTAAVAAGLATLAVGTDTGGSIREPAAQCGVVGMAPTHGLVPLRGVVPFAPDLDRVGPIARSASDAATMLAVMSGRPHLDVLDVLPARPLRVGVVEELMGPANSAEVLRGIDRVLDALAALGIEVVPVSMPEAHRALAAYMRITSAGCVPFLERYVSTGQAGDEVVRRWTIGRQLLGADIDLLADARRLQRRLTEQSHLALAQCDVLLSPTMPTTAPLLTDETDDLADVTVHDLADPMAAPYTDCWTVVANLCRLPSVSIPAGTSASNAMPVAAMLSGRPGSDSDLLTLAAALEPAGAYR